jgi:hypothetical protein
MCPRKLKSGICCEYYQGYRLTFCCVLGGRKKTALELHDIRHVVTFIVNFADQQGLALPGRISGFPRDTVKVFVDEK